MNLDLSDDQKMIQDSLARVFKDHSTGPRIRAAEPVGFDKALWETLVEQEIPLLRVPEDRGGGGASILHAILAAEEAGRHLASVPLVEAMVGNRLLALLGPEAAAMPGRGKIVSFALRDAGAEPRQLVPAGAVADAVVCFERDAVTIRAGCPRTGEGVNHGSIPAAVLDLSKASSRQPVSAPGAKAAVLAAIEEWKLLTAALVAAAARKSIENAAEYARERVAFGRKIGEYQGVAHPLADSLTDVDGARLMVWRAADGLARREPHAAALVSMACAWSRSTAMPATLKAMRVFGGYGMTMEYDAQLYFRRVNAWSLVAGDPERELAAVADRLWSGTAVPLPEAGEVGIDFRWGPETDAAAAKMRAFCERRDDEGMRRFMRESLDGFDLELNRALGREGLLYPELPKEFGGLGLSGLEACAVREVQEEYFWNLLGPGVTELVWKIIHNFGNDALKGEVLPKLVSGEAYCSLGYTEPSGGSDIFAAKTTATRDGDDWLINGQKMFTSTGHLADYSLFVARTAPDKYKGITIFVVPVKQPGYLVTEIKTIGDDRTNVSFYADVRVPDRYRLGEVNGGVKVMALALTLEQSSGGLYTASLDFLLRHALEWAKTVNNGRRPIDDPRVRLALAETAMRRAIVDALSRRAVWGYETKTLQKHQGPMVKLLGSESWLGCSEKLLRVAAPDSQTREAFGVGVIEWMSRRAIPGTIYAGTSEIQRSIVAEAGLALPRTRG